MQSRAWTFSTLDAWCVSMVMVLVSEGGISILMSVPSFHHTLLCLEILHTIVHAYHSFTLLTLLFMIIHFTYQCARLYTVQRLFNRGLYMYQTFVWQMCPPRYCLRWTFRHNSRLWLGAIHPQRVNKIYACVSFCLMLAESCHRLKEGRKLWYLCVLFMASNET